MSIKEIYLCIPLKRNSMNDTQDEIAVPVASCPHKKLVKINGKMKKTCTYIRKSDFCMHQHTEIIDTERPVYVPKPKKTNPILDISLKD